MTFDMFFEGFKNCLSEVKAQDDRLRVAAEEIASFFGVRSHEIGLFSVDHPRHSITFRWPASMAKVGHIPLNAVNSLVAKTANERQVFLDNDFAHTRHLFMFEHMLADKSERIAAQKMMSVPIMSGDTVTGVIQIVRKGASKAEAGKDFTRQNLADLERIAGILGEYRV